MVATSLAADTKTELLSHLEASRSLRRRERHQIVIPALELIHELGVSLDKDLLPIVPSSIKVREAMRSKIASYDHIMPSGKALEEHILARNMPYLPSVTHVLNEGTYEEMPWTTYSLLRHYRKILEPKNVFIYDGNTVLGVHYFFPEEVEAARARMQATERDISGQGAPIQTSDPHAAFQLHLSIKTSSGTRLPYTFGFLRYALSDDREARRGISTIAIEPWAIAATYNPAIIRGFNQVVRLQSHDGLVHNLWNQNGAVTEKELEDFWAKMNENPWNGQANPQPPNNEHDSAVAHYLVLREFSRFYPRFETVVIKRALQYEAQVQIATDLYRARLEACSPNRRGSRLAAEDFKDYWLDVYFKRSLCFIAAPEHYPDVQGVFDRNPFLKEGRQYVQAVIKSAERRKPAFNGKNFGELIQVYRAGLKRFEYEA